MQSVLAPGIGRYLGPRRHLGPTIALTIRVGGYVGNSVVVCRGFGRGIPQGLGALLGLLRLAGGQEHDKKNKCSTHDGLGVEHA